jgi:hypothetical protein
VRRAAAGIVLNAITVSRRDDLTRCADLDGRRKVQGFLHAPCGE